jgi:competence protein ComEC
LLEWLSSVSWSVWQQPSPPIWALPLAVIGVVLLLLPRAFVARWTGLLWLLPLFSNGSTELEAGAFRYTMLEIGHGLASVVETRNHLLVYDTGPSFAGGINAGKTVVVPFLQQLGVNRIDTLIISHGDNDHIGGHRAVLDRFDASRILTSVPAKIPTSIKCQSGQSWNRDGVRFEVLWPSPDYTGAGNNASCVLRVSSRYGSLLLTGDIEKPVEKRLINADIDLAADVLQVPHQGSKTSSTGAFLDKVRPTTALVSIGYLNRYSHPHKTVSDRYAGLQIPLYNTAQEGAITANFTASGIHLQGHRATHPKYWHTRGRTRITY